MSVTYVLFDPTAAPGLKFKSAAVRAEIAAAATANLTPGSVTETLIGNGAVTVNKVADGSITNPKIAVGAVKAPQLGSKAVTTPAIMPGAITPGLVAPGIALTYDAAGNPITLKLVTLTNAAYSALSSPDAGTLYFVKP